MYPFLRINRQGTYSPDAADTFRPLSQVVPLPGGRWKGSVRCFTTRKRHLAYTLVARWDTGYKGLDTQSARPPTDQPHQKAA